MGEGFTFLEALLKTYGESPNRAICGELLIVDARVNFIDLSSSLSFFNSVSSRKRCL
jgi:hypothetical protein